MAPEKIYNDELTELSDLWAAGVITYYMLAGFPPFMADCEEKLFKKIKTCDFEFNELENAVSKDCLDFIECLLQPIVKRRTTAAQALEHKWIKKHITPPSLNP